MYRAWDKKEKEMLHNVNPLFNQYGELDAIIVNYQLNGIGIEIMEYDDAFAYIKNDVDFPYVVMQSTGLKIKDDKEIVVGDVLTANRYPFQDEGKYNYHGVVEWDDEYAAFVITKRCVNENKRGISDGMSELLGNYNLSKFELLGNIYQHPHLLEGATNGSS